MLLVFFLVHIIEILAVIELRGGGSALISLRSSRSSSNISGGAVVVDEFGGFNISIVPT